MKGHIIFGSTITSIKSHLFTEEELIEEIDILYDRYFELQALRFYELIHKIFSYVIKKNGNNV